MTVFQLDASANAPWTSTIDGFAVVCARLTFGPSTTSANRANAAIDRDRRIEVRMNCESTPLFYNRQRTVPSEYFVLPFARTIALLASRCKRKRARL
jgi:hypothetical protein